jgi:ligand-binding sensor domain-containing protein
MQALFIFILLFAVVFTQAQTPAFINYQTDEGLAGNQINDIIQDKNGFLWIATENGISRFDGSGFTNFNMSNQLPENEIVKFFEDKNGRLWMATVNGKISFYENGRFYNQNNAQILKNLQLNGIVTAIFEDSKNNIWFAGNLGEIIALNKEGYQIKYNTYGIIEEIWESADKGIFFAHQRLGVIPLSKINKDPQPFTYFNKFHRDAGGRMFSSIENELFIYDPNANIELKLNANNPFQSEITGIFSDTENQQIWIGTNNGIYVKNLNPKKEQEYTRYLEEENITKTYIDREGNIWIGTSGSGIYYTPSLEVKTYSATNKNRQIFALANDKNGKIWFGGSSGNFGYIENGIKVNFPLELKPGEKVQHIASVDKSIWVGTNIKIHWIENQVYKGNLPFSAKYIIPIQQDSFWIAGKQIVFKTPINKLQQLITQKNQVAMQQFILQLKNEVLNRNANWLSIINKERYIATDNGLLTDNLSLIDKIENYPINGLKGRIAHIDALQNKYAVVATNGYGIFIDLVDTVLNINVASGLSSNVCKSLLIDYQQNIWIGSSSGLNKLKLNIEEKKYTIQKYSSIDGLASDEINDIELQADTFFVATGKGISAFTEKALRLKLIPPNIHINKVLYQENEINEEKTLSIPYPKNQIEIAYTGLSFRSKGNMQFRYKLKGLEDEWRYTESNKVTFSMLPPGNYNFVVQVKNKEGLWSSISRPVIFTIQPPFYQTAWFIILSAIAVSGVVFIILYQSAKNIEQKAKQEAAIKLKINEAEQKALRAQMNPHFIFNALNSIQRYVIAKDTFAAYNYLEKFSKLIRAILENSQYKKISLDEELQTIDLYIQIESLRFDNKFSYSIAIAPNVNRDFKIPTMLIQPFIENAIWHGLLPKKDKTDLKLDIEIYSQASFLIIEIEDNGIGRKRSEEIKENNRLKKNSLGMKITQERIDSLNNGLNETGINLEIIDLLDNQANPKGTKVCISINTQQEI